MASSSGCVYDAELDKQKKIAAQPLIHLPDHHALEPDDYPFKRLVSLDSAVHFKRPGTLPLVSTQGKYIFVQFECGMRLTINPFRDMKENPMEPSEYDYKEGKFVEDTERLVAEYEARQEKDRPWGLFSHEKDLAGSEADDEDIEDETETEKKKSEIEWEPIRD